MEGSLVGDRFEVGALIGRGAVGAVYRATDRTMGRPVALKVVKLAERTEAWAERFRREGEITASLSHPGIVRVFSCGEQEEFAYIAYELVEGAETLEDLFARSSLEANVASLAATAEALGHAHAQGVVHRDVKPSNVLVTPEGQIRVADFGLATAQGLSRLTKTGTILGTPYFMGPEQFRAKDREGVGPHSDVWALGVILYQLLTGVLPFQGESFWEFVARVNKASPTPPRGINPDAPRDLEAACLRALQADPGDRYVDASAFAAVLRAWLAGERASPRHRLGVILLVVGVLVGAAALGLTLLPPSSPPLEDESPAVTQVLATPPQGWAASPGDASAYTLSWSVTRRQVEGGTQFTAFGAVLEAEEVVEAASPEAISFRTKPSAFKVWVEGGVWLCYDSRDPGREWRSLDAMLESEWTATRSVETNAVADVRGATAGRGLIARRMQEQNVAPSILSAAFEKGFNDQRLARRLSSIAGILPARGDWSRPSYTKEFELWVGEHQVRCTVRVEAQGEHFFGEMVEVKGALAQDGQLRDPALRLSARFAEGRLLGSWIDLSYVAEGQISERIRYRLSLTAGGVREVTLPNDPGAALAGWIEAAERGDSIAMLTLGRARLDAIGSKQDVAEALRWFARAHGAGRVEGLVEAGRVHLSGAPGLPPNPPQAMALFQQAIDSGHLEAAADLAVCHRLGLGTSVDKRKALLLLSRAAKVGYAPAMTSLGDMHRFGEGTVRDLVKAESHYRSAARAGDARASEELIDLQQLIANIRAH